MSPRPRKRVLSRAVSPWQLRNLSAQAKGYRNYYDYRIHDFGRRAPGTLEFRERHGEELARRRGHRSLADLVGGRGGRGYIREGSLVFVADKGPRDAKGQYKWVDIRVVDEHGGERTFRLRGKEASQSNLARIVSETEARRGVLSPAPSLDVRRLAPQVARRARYQVIVAGPALAVVVDTHDSNRAVRRFNGPTSSSRAHTFAERLNLEDEGEG